MSLEETSNKMETAWLTKELTFRHEKMKDVFQCLKRKFGVTFNIKNKIYYRMCIQVLLMMKYKKRSECVENTLRI